MSRSGYSDDLDTLDLGRWRGQVASASRGKRGQKFFADLIVALDALPAPRLVKNEFENVEGDVCALGALGKMRGVNIGEIDPDMDDYEALGVTFDIAHQLAQETLYVNDDNSYLMSPERRWISVRAWAVSQLRARVLGEP